MGQRSHCMRRATPFLVAPAITSPLSWSIVALPHSLHQSTTPLWPYGPPGRRPSRGCQPGCELTCCRKAASRQPGLLLLGPATGGDELSGAVPTAAAAAALSWTAPATPAATLHSLNCTTCCLLACRCSPTAARLAGLPARPSSGYPVRQLPRDFVWRGLRPLPHGPPLQHLRHWRPSRVC
jgi:hypothetical protein